jgi:uridine kinase
MKLSKPIIIGIAGGTASGKTSIAEILRDSFKNSNSVTIIKEDDYYKDQSNMTMEERVKTNYDHPLAFDFDFMLEQLKQLLACKQIEKPIYDFTVHNRSKEIEIIKPSDVIILEGLFALYTPEIRELEEIKIFVDTPADVRFIRRLARDIKERNRTMENVMSQYLETVKPMHDQFIEPTKKYADVIIPEGRSNTVGIDLIKTKIGSIIDEKML